MTPAHLRRLIATCEHHSQRQLAQEVVCPSCRASIDRPCRNRAREPMPMEHPARIRKAEKLRAEGVSECSFCQRRNRPAEQRESAPWPTTLVWCGWHRRLYQEIKEAEEMAQNLDAAQWDGHLKRHVDRLIAAGRTGAYARRRATEQTTELFGPRPEEVA